MKARTTTILAGGMAVLFTTAGAARQFEGIVTQRTITVERQALEERGFGVSGALFDAPTEDIVALREALEASGEMTVTTTDLAVKGGLVRMNMETDEGPAYVLIDIGQGVMRMVQPDRGMYIEMTQADVERLQSMRGALGGPSTPSDRPEPVATGRTRTIAGLRTHAYDLVDEDGPTRVWASKDLPGLVTAFAALMDRMGQMSMDDDVDNISHLIAEYGFPVLMQRLTQDEYEIQEIVSFERRSLGADVFAPPAGFRKMTMADMIGR